MPTNVKKSVKKVAAKKVAHKRAPAAAVHKTTVRTKKAPVMKSFHASRREEPFMTFRVNNQTAYWLILAVLVIALGVWVTVISVRVQNIYDQIDATNNQAYSMPFPMNPVKQ